MTEPSDGQSHEDELALLKAQAQLKDSEAKALESRAKSRHSTAALITAVGAALTAIGGLGIWQLMGGGETPSAKPTPAVVADPAPVTVPAPGQKVRTQPAFLPDSQGRVLDPTNCLPGSLKAAADDVDECREVVAGKIEPDNIVRDVRWLDSGGVAWKILDADYQPFLLEASCSCRLAAP